ncbi:hypothetical protein AA103193_0026 [Tanticharoenia sakaeratensis NBRC 103193]|nr:hypothetical protein AA103193_0026 [Tanticharoenia sakaeratensis NBRC 103193]
MGDGIRDLGIRRQQRPVIVQLRAVEREFRQEQQHEAGQALQGKGHAEGEADPAVEFAKHGPFDPANEN